METRANYVIVGLFTVLAILAAFAFIYWTAGFGDRGATAPIQFRIPGSAAGLGPGSAVLFNGVKVGDVNRVHLDVNNPSVAIADAVVRRSTPITRSTRADVGLAGLTGQANIELSGGDPGEPNLLDLAEEQGEIAVIMATPSPIANLLQTTQSLLTRADSVIGRLEGFVEDAGEPLINTFQNVERFSDGLARNADGIDTFLENVSGLSQTISEVSGRLDSTLAAAEQLINSVDRNRVAEILENVDNFTQRLSSASDQLDTIVAGVDEAVASINSFSQKANQTIDRVDNIVEGVDPQTVADAVRNFEQASSSIDRASADIARVSETISEREEDIDQFISDARELASRLNQASVRVDGVLTKVDNMLDSGDGNDLVAEARATLQAFREVAETLQSRVGPITDGLARFSGQGLRDIEALVNESRRSISRIESAITQFEQNPQRIITGGEGSIRRYEGRNRR
ncbi:MlaD family protein [Chelativorans sp. M5D2P16]|uniref:MlaD family protein n=1 Tax=Chelativorans sp. M5D2P16 TaxID=3095678 RepID=UPI002ACA5589|nr:MlaD family protein [Chelativorans sp. M5D2P16]MDZ5697617.1 MlaD family protein [Chelativorans sp. M5D2P16]